MLSLRQLLFISHHRSYPSTSSPSTGQLEFTSAANTPYAPTCNVPSSSPKLFSNRPYHVQLEPMLRVASLEPISKLSPSLPLLPTEASASLSPYITGSHETFSTATPILFTHARLRHSLTALPTCKWHTFSPLAMSFPLLGYSHLHASSLTQLTPNVQPLPP